MNQTNQPQIRIPDEGVSVQLLGDEIIRILQALGKGSYEVSAPIINKIQQQVIAQQVPPRYIGPVPGAPVSADNEAIDAGPTTNQA